MESAPEHHSCVISPLLEQKEDKVAGVEELPIHDQVFGKGIATYRQTISIAPLAVMYFLSQFYTLVDVLASLVTPSFAQWLLANNVGDKLRSCCQFSGVLVPDT